MKSTRKPKGSLRDQLSADYLKIFQEDFAANGVKVIQALRDKSPEKYAEIAARLIAATEPPNPNDYSQCQSQEEIAVKLLQSVGLEGEATEEQIQEAIAAKDRFTEQLEAIRGRAQLTEQELN